MRHEAEFEELFRVGSDYGELLKRGEVRRQVDDPDEWRAEIRRQARRDGFRVRTFLVNDETGFVLAALTSRPVDERGLAASLQWRDARFAAAAQATELGHELGEWARLGDRSGARCQRCGARLYFEARARPDVPVIDGEAITESCEEVSRRTLEFDPRRVPGAERAIAEERKFTEYLLNREHPIGGAKARFFNALGYERSNWEALRREILSRLPYVEAQRRPTGRHNVAHFVAVITLSGPRGSATVVTVWAVSVNVRRSPPRLITAYPARKQPGKP